MAITQLGSNNPIMTAAADEITGSMFVKSFRWVCDGSAVAGHHLVVGDSAGNVFFDSYADGAYYIDIMPVYKQLKGIKVSTISSGKLYVNLG